MERGRGWFGGLCVGAMNLAGAAPTLVNLWFNGHNVDTALASLTDIFALLLIYGSAAIGWVIYTMTPNLVATYMTMTAGRRITALKAQQKELTQQWGPDVESTYEPNVKSKE